MIQVRLIKLLSALPLSPMHPTNEVSAKSIVKCHAERWWRQRIVLKSEKSQKGVSPVSPSLPLLVSTSAVLRTGILFLSWALQAPEDWVRQCEIYSVPPSPHSLQSPAISTLCWSPHLINWQPNIWDGYNTGQHTLLFCFLGRVSHSPC